MIKPTNGRIVLFTSHPGDVPHDGKPLAAIVTHVYHDRMVNLCVFDMYGERVAKTSVPLLQDEDAPLPGGYYCEWMPYQKGQAAKTEAAEQALVDRQHV